MSESKDFSSINPPPPSLLSRSSLLSTYESSLSLSPSYSVPMGMGPPSLSSSSLINTNDVYRGLKDPSASGSTSVYHQQSLVNSMSYDHLQDGQLLFNKHNDHHETSKSGIPMVFLQSTVKKRDSDDEDEDVNHNNHNDNHHSFLPPRGDTPSPSSQSDDPPFPPSNFLEPNSHFYVNSEPLDALKLLLSTLSSQSVDCQLVTDEFKIFCEAYSSHSKIEFVARIFSPPQNLCLPPEKRFACEFQRRFGDGMTFFQLYRKVKGTMTSSSVIPIPVVISTIPVVIPPSAASIPNLNKEFQQSISPLICLPAPTMCSEMLRNMDKPCVMECISKSIKNLVSMCDTDCVDVKSQALCALACMSEKSELHSYLQQYGATALFLKSIGCTYGDCFRAGAAALANMTSKDKVLCQSLLDNSVFRNNLLRLSHMSSNAEVIRQASKTLCNVAHQLGKNSIQHDEQIMETVNLFAASTDKVTANNGIDMLELVGM